MAVLKFDDGWHQAARAKRRPPDWSWRGQCLRDLRRLFRRRIGEEPSLQELDAAIYAVVDPDLDSYDPKSLGVAIELTFAEYKMFDRLPRTMRPCDVTDEQVAVYLHERKKKRDKITARKRREADREKRAALFDLDVRKETLFAAIGPRRMTVPDLVQIVGQAPCWRPLKGASRERVMRRELNDLKRLGKINGCIDVGRRNRRVLFVWRFPKADAVRSSRTAGQSDTSESLRRKKAHGT